MDNANHPLNCRNMTGRCIRSRYYTSPERTLLNDKIEPGEEMRKIVMNGQEGWIANRTVGLLAFRDSDNVLSSPFTLGNPADIIESLPPNSVVYVAEHGATKAKSYVRASIDGKWGQGDRRNGKASISYTSGRSSAKALASRLSRSKKVFAYCVRTPDQSPWL